MKVLVVGGGGREHALCWKLAQSKSVHKIFCAPGNAGTALVAENVTIGALDIEGLRLFAEQNCVDLTVVGPESALIAGIVDAFEARGLRIFGPSREPAQIEGSKAFSKGLMRKANIPTADFEVFDNADRARDYLRGRAQNGAFPLVVKADGGAAGKRVVRARSLDDALTAVHDMMERRVFGASGDRVVIEECLTGEETSVMAFVDGETLAPMIAIQDHKRAFDGDTGPNTGGMGAYAPVPAVPAPVMDTIARTILTPAMHAIRETGIPYQGVLYAGVMLTPTGPQCLEFNCRFGDPETQVALPLLVTDLAEVLCAVVDVELDRTPVRFSDRTALSIVLASGGYPGPYETGKTITGLESVAKMDAVAVFHAGTRQNEGQIVTDGGRVLSVTATGDTFAEAHERAYAAAKKIQFEGAFYRNDIGGNRESL